MGKKHMNRCPTLLVTCEMQIKTTVRCHFTLTRMAMIKRWKITSESEDVENNPSKVQLGMENGTASLENSFPFVHQS